MFAVGGNNWSDSSKPAQQVERPAITMIWHDAGDDLIRLMQRYFYNKKSGRFNPYSIPQPVESESVPENLFATVKADSPPLKTGVHNEPSLFTYTSLPAIFHFC